MIHRWHLLACACMGLVACKSSRTIDIKEKKTGSGGTASTSDDSTGGTVGTPTGGTGGTSGIESSGGTGGSGGVGGGDTGIGGAAGDFSDAAGAGGQPVDTECRPGDDCDAEPVCGDGTLNNDEECDDGNTDNGDTCNAECRNDADGDGVADTTDNCPTIANADQADTNATLIGDACEGPAGYVFCANQGERCEFEGTAYVAFGNDGSYIYAYNVVNGIQCDNPDPIAGADPLPNEPKSCFYRLGECTPACSGKVCGDNACGGSCGSCSDGWLCAGDQRACDIDPNQWFHLKSEYQGDDMCLESNDPDNGTAHGGFAFMEPCSNTTGRSWKFVKDGDWYRLKSAFQGDDMCLESNDPSTGDLGAAYMDDCQNVSGQLWQLVPDRDGYKLKSQYQGDGKCLESNSPTNTAPGNYGGNAYMDDCQNVTGQRWYLVPL